MGFDLGFALYRGSALTAEELNALEQHLRAWRTRIIGYDWHVPRNPHRIIGELIAWGTLRPAHGMPGMFDQGGELAEVVEAVRAALANVSTMFNDVRLAFADEHGPLAWNGTQFEYSRDAEYPDIPAADDGGWISLATMCSIPDGRPAVGPGADAQRRRSTTKGATAAMIAAADLPTLIKMVLAPASGKVSDLERTAAIERLASEPDPKAAAALVQRSRSDGAERKWTPVLLRGLASGRARCSWATPLLAFDRGWRGAAELVLSSVTEDAIPYLERLPIGRMWSSLVLLSLDSLDSPAARDAKNRLLDRVIDPVPAARLLVVAGIAAAHHASGSDRKAALQRIAAALKAYGSAGGDAQVWLAHQREAGTRALAILDGSHVTDETILQGLAALAEYAVTGRDPVRLPDDQRRALWQLEGEWLARHGHT